MGDHEGGFTLTEALVAAALFTILAVVAVPQLVVPEPLRAGLLARELAGDLRLTQRLAIARQATFVLEFSPGAAPYLSYTVRRAGGDAEPDFPKMIHSGVEASGPQQFVFGPDGRASAGGTVTLTVAGATATVTVVAATGRVQVVVP